MPYFTSASLESLRHKVDLADFLSSYIDLKRAGATYKALCPFHDEKTPSFTVRPGDSHYHCFGCGAHGDVIQFAMQHLSLSFQDAVEMLAQRYHVRLEYEKGTTGDSVASGRLRELNAQALRVFQFFLLHSEEGREACRYLTSRGMDEDFIRRYGIGYALRSQGMLFSILAEKGYTEKEMVDAGLLRKADGGKVRDFFVERITFPIYAQSGAVIGFSARKIREEVFGGKYINTSETPIFKKSKVLFGLHLARRAIAKEQKVLICEGQVDVLKLNYAGFPHAVAALGTAFGAEHARELIRLGVKEAFLIFDSDSAGNAAAVKTGNLLMYEGIDVRVVSLPAKDDPDSYLTKYGKEKLEEKIKQATGFLEFAFGLRRVAIDMDSPAQKAALVNEMLAMIKGWENKLLIHESVKKLALLANVPEEMLHHPKPAAFIQVSSVGKLPSIDPHKILEEDFIRWLILQGGTDPFFYEVAKANIPASFLKTVDVRALYQAVLQSFSEGIYDFLGITSRCSSEEAVDLLEVLLRKRVPVKEARELFSRSVEKLLKREWMEEREKVRMQIQNNQENEEEVLLLVKQFDALKRSPPMIIFPEQVAHAE